MSGGGDIAIIIGQYFDNYFEIIDVCSMRVLGVAGKLAFSRIFDASARAQENLKLRRNFYVSFGFMT